MSPQSSYPLVLSLPFQTAKTKSSNYLQLSITHPRGILKFCQTFHMWPGFLPPHHWGHYPLNMFQFVYTHPSIGQGSTHAEETYHFTVPDNIPMPIMSKNPFAFLEITSSWVTAIYHSTAKSLLHTQVQDLICISINALCARLSVNLASPPPIVFPALQEKT